MWAVITHDRRVYVLPISPTLPAILEAAHDGSHEGVQKTLHQMCCDFDVTRVRSVAEDYVRAYIVCQRNKTEMLHPTGLLQPLPVPSQVWADISMDFIKGLSSVHGKPVILTVVDYFSKYAGHASFLLAIRTR